MIKSHGLFHDVQTEQGTLRCTARGKLKIERRESGGIVVGDRVAIDLTAPGEGVVAEVKPRERVLVRRHVMRGQPDQILLANPGRLLAVFAVAEPAPHLRMLDRFLVLASAHDLDAAICVNKIDLDPTGELREVFAVYTRIGYTVIHSSARSGEGIDTLGELIAGQIIVLAGPSGVGKTSLLNRATGVNLRTAQISEATGKGRHTTRGATLVPAAGGYIADTAGIRALALAGVEINELDLHFREFGPFLGSCRFADCVHSAEPDCAIAAAAASGVISPARYDSYLRLRESFDAD